MREAHVLENQDARALSEHAGHPQGPKATEATGALQRWRGWCHERCGASGVGPTVPGGWSLMDRAAEAGGVRGRIDDLHCTSDPEPPSGATDAITCPLP
jgi:hypothetical protein